MADDRVSCVHVHPKALDAHLHGTRAPGADEAVQASGERQSLQESAETRAAGKQALIRNEQGLPQPVSIARIGSRYSHDDRPEAYLSAPSHGNPSAPFVPVFPRTEVRSGRVTRLVTGAHGTHRKSA